MNSSWFISCSVMWDEEREKNRIIGTYSIASCLGYKTNRKWSIATGLGKGIIGNENEKRRYNLINGDWSTGINSTYNFLLFTKQFSLTSALEYNITQKEYSFSIDLNFTLPW